MTNNAPLIFHHKNVSPYSEKIRLMLGYAECHWQSVLVPLTPPRLSLDTLIDGYRRIPVAQIGADVFCDTRIISAEIALLTDKPQLNPFAQSEQHWRRAEYIESDIFQVALNSLNVLGLVRALLSQIPLNQLVNYLSDKKFLYENSHPDLIANARSRAESKALWQQYLDELEASLTNDFLTGKEPQYVDFCAVHLIWFRMGMEGSVLFKRRAKLKSWYQKMTNFNHGKSIDISAIDAISEAKNAQPRVLAPDMLQSARIGKRVSVATTDVLVGETHGCLVGENDERWIIAKQNQATGLVHIHFPKTTYLLTEL